MRLFERIKHHFVPSEGNAYRPHLLHRPWLVFFFVVILATEGFLVSNLIARQSSQNFLAAVVPAEIIALTNTERAQNNAGLVADDALLDAAAQAKANDMAAYGYFSHTGPDGKTPWQWITASGYKYQYAGENLAVRFVDSSDVVNAWMESPTHRANIVKPVYTAIGVGVAQGMYEGQSATFVVQYFGTPLNDSAVPQNSNLVANAPTIKPAKTTAASNITPALSPAPVAVSIPKGGQVEGVAVTAAPASGAASNLASYSQSFIKQILRAFAEPKATANWIIGLCAAILFIVIALTFFMHVHIQPGHMLMSGAFVALFALSLLAINSRLGGGGSEPGALQSASIAEAGVSYGVVIGEDAASTGFALFPGQ